MRNLVYLSTSRTLLTGVVLLEILTDARKSNKQHNVTGVLLYCEGTFIQLLEGSDEAIDIIFQKIEQDTRHKNIIVLMDEPLKERNFANWTMGFAEINNEASEKFISDLITTENILSKDGNHAALVMLKAFIDSNNLVIQ